MAWEIKRTNEILEWVNLLDDDAKESILKSLIILSEFGPTLGRPHVDSIKNSEYTNMKELRVQNKKRVFRIFFVFDPVKRAILLIGGDKKGDNNFYKKMIPIADKLYSNHLEDLKNERKK